MREQIDRVKNWKQFLNENMVNNLQNIISKIGERYSKEHNKTAHQLNSGDCEDIAILKYSLLVKNGIKKENIKIYFTIVKNQGHVFLEVIDSNRIYYLDNISNNIMINIHERKLDIFVQSNKFSKLFEIATKDI